MANTFAPFGFSQYRGTGSAPTFEQTIRSVALTAGAIYSGDPVTTVASDGTVAAAAPSTAAIAGIFVGCKYVSAAVGRTVWSSYWPGSGSALAGTTVEAYIINDPNAQFLVQTGNSGAAVTAANIGENISYALGTGSAITGLSGANAPQSTLGTTATLAFRVVGLHTFPPGANGTDATSVGNQIIVAFNNVETKTLTGTA